MPAMRADLSVCEGYRYQRGDLLDCAVTAFGGMDDERVTREDLAGWGGLTTGRFRMQVFPGGHFYIKTSRIAVVQAIGAELAEENRPVEGPAVIPRVDPTI
jgi:medium-chain acyl-[acyl-carrier-protein] hydrolase